MGYIDSFLDICEMETGFLQYTIELLKKDYAKELKMLGIILPNVEKFRMSVKMKQSNWFLKSMIEKSVIHLI